MSLWGRAKGTLFFVPKYGYYGAPHYGCGKVDKDRHACPKPKDKMDSLFRKHDNGKSDGWLVDNLKKLDPKKDLYAVRTNQDWAEQLSARTYRHLAIAWFSITRHFTDKKEK